MITKNKLWKQLEFGINNDNYYGGHLNGLQDIAEVKNGKRIPELSLWLSVLIDAAKHEDMVFINSNGKAICDKAGLDYKVVYNSFENIWNM